MNSHSERMGQMLAGIQQLRPLCEQADVRLVSDTVDPLSNSENQTRNADGLPII
jgi:hypothetical protein